jgi:4-amino-4-deoxy-L-arabinose transferase-like glycosyltransferase
MTSISSQDAVLARPPLAPSLAWARVKPAAWMAAVVLVVALAQALAWRPSEPFHNNDETRHVLTGVFFHDFLVDLPLDRPRAYAVEYYLQYPALGLMVWPPLFHGVEGVFMLAFGTSFLTARAVVWLFCALAGAYLFLLVRRTHDTFAATAAVLLFGLSPMVFELTRRVMLEIPALAFGLAAVYHFVRYLDDGRRRDIFLAATAAACLALTRYDGPCLILFFVLYLLGLRRFDVLRRREVWLAALLALVLVLPVYVPMLAGFGKAHFQLTVTGGANSERTGDGPLAALAFYPGTLVRQIGWAILVPSVVGLLAALGPARRRACWPYLALAAATYLTFTPLAERQARHAIYWVPAFVLFAVEGITWIAGRLPRFSRLRRPQTAAVLAGLVAGLAFWRVAARPATYVRGYAEAARYVVANTRSSRFCLMDGYLNGDFIYQIRRHDPARRLWALRGDKILYSVLTDPRTGYREYAGGESGILDMLFRYDPELIVIEEPQVYFKIPMAEQLRRTLAGHPERFERVKVFPIESNAVMFAGAQLAVYRSKVRNPNPARQVTLDMIGLGQTLGADLPADPQKR